MSVRNPEPLLAGGLKKSPAGDGMIDMEIPYDTLEWAAAYFLSLGTSATVLEPAELTGLMGGGGSLLDRVFPL